MVMHLVSPDLISQKMGILKTQDGSGCHVEKLKNYDTATMD